MISRGIKISPVCLALFTLTAGSAHAQMAGVGYHLKVGVGQSDNIARAPVDEQSETIGSAGFDFSILKRTDKLALNAMADFSWLDYFDNTYDGEVFGNFNGQANFEWIPERFAWSIQDNFGQVRIDPFAALTPVNRENINYLTTGPDLTFGLGSGTRLRFSGRYSDVAYEDTPLDSQRLSGSAALMHSLSARKILSLNLQTESIDFDSGPDSLDYDRDQAFLRYDATGARTVLAADLGYSRLNRREDTSSGLVARLEVSRRMSASSRLLVSAGQEFSDASDSFRMEQGLRGGGMEAQPSQTTDPFTNTYASLGWQFNRNRTGLDVSVTHYDEAYETSGALDRKRLVANAGISRTLTPTMSLSVGGSYSREDFDSVAGDFNETGAMAGLTRHFGRNLSASLQYNYSRRNSDLPGSDYTENRFWLSFAYGKDAPQPASNPPPAQ